MMSRGAVITLYTFVVVKKKIRSCYAHDFLDRGNVRSDAAPFELKFI